MLIAFCTPFSGPASPEHYRRRAIVQSQALSHRFINAETDLFIVSRARNMLLDSLPKEVELIWFVDSDVLLPLNAAALLDHLEENPVVSGLYFSRRYPYLPQVYYKADPSPTGFTYLPMIQIPDQPFYADTVGAGCLLVKHSVIEELRTAHLKWRGEIETWRETSWPNLFPRRTKLSESVERALRLGAMLAPCFEFLEKVGEDFWFCEQLQYFLGIKPLVVPSVECEHEGMKAYGRQDFLQALSQGNVNFVTTQPRPELGSL